MSYGSFQNLPPLSIEEPEPRGNILVNFARGELTYKSMIARGGMGEISFYHLNKRGYPTEVAVKTLFRKSVSDR